MPFLNQLVQSDSHSLNISMSVTALLCYCVRQPQALLGLVRLQAQRQRQSRDCHHMSQEEGCWFRILGNVYSFFLALLIFPKAMLTSLCNLFLTIYFRLLNISEWNTFDLIPTSAICSGLSPTHLFSSPPPFNAKGLLYASHQLPQNTHTPQT